MVSLDANLDTSDGDGLFEEDVGVRGDVDDVDLFVFPRFFAREGDTVGVGRVVVEVGVGDLGGHDGPGSDSDGVALESIMNGPAVTRRLTTRREKKTQSKDNLLVFMGDFVVVEVNFLSRVASVSLRTRKDFSLCPAEFLEVLEGSFDRHNKEEEVVVVVDRIWRWRDEDYSLMRKRRGGP